MNTSKPQQQNGLNTAIKEILAEEEEIKRKYLYLKSFWMQVLQDIRKRPFQAVESDYISAEYLRYEMKCALRNDIFEKRLAFKSKMKISDCAVVALSMAIKLFTMELSLQAYTSSGCMSKVTIDDLERAIDKSEQHMFLIFAKRKYSLQYMQENVPNNMNDVLNVPTNTNIEPL